VAEVALSLLLLTGAGLLIKSLDELHQVDKGFDETNVLTLNVPISITKYTEEGVWLAFQTEILQRVRALPGVEFAATSNILPLGRNGWETGIAPEGVDPRDPDNRASVLNMMVHTDYFDAMSIPIIRGRGFTLADDASNPLVAVVDETLAERYWPGEDPIGRRVTMEWDMDDQPGLTDGDVPVYRTVIGVAKHVRHYELQEPSRIEIYRPMLQARNAWGFPPYIIVKTTTDPTPLVQPIREEILSIDADQPVVQIRTMTDVVDSQVATFAAMRGLLVIFGVLALVLAAIGIYGVMSYSVAQRVREIGIRVALGAQAGQVRWLMSKQGLRLALAGLALGLVGSVAITRSLQSLLYGVGAAEPATMAWVSVILFAVTNLATYVPAARATRVDPGTVLREE
jgi:putative ABC transport system permease protein